MLVIEFYSSITWIHVPEYEPRNIGSEDLAEILQEELWKTLNQMKDRQGEITLEILKLDTNPLQNATLVLLKKCMHKNRADSTLTKKKKLQISSITIPYAYWAIFTKFSVRL